ncbi:bifunctional adenosylcobinamide kinase/adenosylcobinamide-phosphate guanylyltransferase [Bacillus daqingensis]|uniref:Bifunctional adenosylcobinamide kinase/adenosylcobinamide-phosphate guanylyltransferase n=1 Tax=Bacillus daqingensis TaxID=872396 RepID=A0ABV9NVW9_9BACI
MHIIIGGAYAGKREHADRSYPEAEWINAGGKRPPKADVTIVTGCSAWLRSGHTSADVIDWLETLSDQTCVVVIIEEMGNGIVPADAGDRRLRDENGRLAQKLVKAAETVDYVWHGLVKRKKP